MARAGKPHPFRELQTRLARRYRLTTFNLALSILRELNDRHYDMEKSQHGLLGPPKDRLLT